MRGALTKIEKLRALVAEWRKAEGRRHWPAWAAFNTAADELESILAEDAGDGWRPCPECGALPDEKCRNTGEERCGPPPPGAAP